MPDELCRGAPPRDLPPGGHVPERADPPGCVPIARDDTVALRRPSPGCHGSTRQPGVGPAPPEQPENTYSGSQGAALMT